MGTVHILTRNNARTIRATLDSVAALDMTVLVGDLGSTDETVDLCLSRRARVHRMGRRRRDEARNEMVGIADGPHFYIEPWEVLVQGGAAVASGKTGYAKIMQGSTVTHDIRMWDGTARFVNPIYERLDLQDAASTPVIISSQGGLDPDYCVEELEAWKRDKPLLPTPHYYHACVLLARGSYEDFIKMADHYLFMEKGVSMSTVMTRYYYAMVQVIHKKAYKPALQNLNLCLCAKPLMAEFWCLTGDVYYHLLSRFDSAKEFYENAILLGQRRLQTDRWPMDFSKYKKYPNMMIKSCEDILSDRGLFLLNHAESRGRQSSS
jgi:glycosyltransferase involved in cell wall biosynthesis